MIIKSIEFRPGAVGSMAIRVDSPEELAASGIRMSDDFINRTWGPDAPERYRQVLTENAHRDILASNSSPATPTAK